MNIEDVKISMKVKCTDNDCIMPKGKTGTVIYKNNAYILLEGQTDMCNPAFYEELGAK